MNKSGIITFTVKTLVDGKLVTERITKAAHGAQARLDAQVINDANFYVPLKTGTLQKSAIINTVLGSGLVVWRTDYARRQYYGEGFDHSKQHNPNACAKWFEAAKARKKEQWRRLAEDEIKRR